MQWRRVSSDVSTMRQQSSMVDGGGNLDAACLPCFMAATAMSTCQFQGVAMMTRSRSSRATSFSKCVFAVWCRAPAMAAPPLPPAIAHARPSRARCRTARAPCASAPSRFSSRLVPRPPVPMMPMRGADFSNGTFIMVAALRCRRIVGRQPRHGSAACLAADGAGCADAQKIPAGGLTQRIGRFVFHHSHLSWARRARRPAAPKSCRDSLYRPGRTSPHMAGPPGLSRRPKQALTWTDSKWLA